MAGYGLRYADPQPLHHQYDLSGNTAVYTLFRSVRAQLVDSWNKTADGKVAYCRAGAFLHASSKARLIDAQFLRDGERVDAPPARVSFIGRHREEGWFESFVHYPTYDQQRAAIARAESLAYNRFYRGRRGLLVDSAALGVTLASWKQSRDMIVERSNDVRKFVARLHYAIERDPRRKAQIRRQHKLNPKTPASALLEVKFGWGPLFEDLESAIRNVVAFGVHGDERFYHTGRGKVREQFPDQTVSGGIPGRWREISDWETTMSSTYSACVRVENRNLFMLNRLGLINPALVAWDLVPWSFVVSMFGNFNSLISSITDEVGLEVTNEAITNTVKSRFTTTQRCYGRSYIKTRHETFSKHRRLDEKPALKFEARVPKLNWDLAVTASALAMQRMKRFSDFLRIF